MGFWSFLFGKPNTYESSGRSALALSGGKGVRSRTPTLLDIQVGDVVSYGDIDYVVRNRYTFNSHGFKWFSYHLVDVITNDKLWLDAEDDDALEVAVGRPITLDVKASEVPKEITFEGETYYQDEHGMANVYIESEASSPKYSDVEYWDFTNADDNLFLCLERWGDEMEASASKPIEPYQVTILPGSPDA